MAYSRHSDPSRSEVAVDCDARSCRCQGLCLPPSRVGFAERASELLLAALAGGVIAIPICMLLFAMIFPRLRKRLKTGSFDRHSNWVQSVLFCTQLFVTSILLVQILLVAYTNSVVAHFHQSLAIVAPHVSDDQLMLYKARFAKVRSRKDFIQLYSDVQLVAEKNGEK